MYTVFFSTATMNLSELNSKIIFIETICKLKDIHYATI